MQENPNTTGAELEAITLLTQLRGDRSVDAIAKAREQLGSIEEHYGIELSPIYNQYLGAVEAFRCDRLDEAVERFLGFLERLESESGNDILLAYANVYLGTIFASKGEFYRALDYFKSAESSRRGSDHKLGLFLNINLGGIYIDLEQYPKALEHSEYALEHSKHVTNPVNLSLALCNQAISLAHTEQLDQALEVIERSSQLALTNENWHGYTYSRFYYALILSMKGQNKQAYTAYKESFELVKQHADTYLSIEFYDKYSQFLYRCGHYDFTVKFCQQALRAKGLTDNIRIKLSLLNTLAQCYQQLGEHHQECEVLREACATYKTLINQSKDNEVSYIDSILHHTRAQAEANNSDLFTRNLSYLNELGQMIASTEDHQTDVLKLFDHIGEIVPCSAFSLALYRADRDVLDYKYLLDEGEFQPAFEVECDCVSRIGIYALKNNETLVLDTCSDQELELYLDSGCSANNTWINVDEQPPQSGMSAICTPVVFDGETLGVISVQKSESYVYKDFHVQVVMQLANYIAVSLKNQLQRQELEDNRQYMEQIYRTDHLTGLKNRFGLRPYLEELATRYGSGFDIATVLIDVDYLKAFNNHYGMDRGDDLLVTIADILRYVSKGEGEAFRIGGDEFAILLPYPKIDKAIDIAQAIKAHLKRSEIENHGAETETFVTCTVGVVDSSNMQDVVAFEQQVLTGERALIKAKKHQRNRLLRYEYTN
ncbi:diguanylate cyclase [Vibrio sp. D404a]|uniref:diguanylate cyclase domain-containing protein n=1 Tax=unclassified Vibrio TaxID=2614977 RepID=UPI002557B256|nr:MULTISPECIES: diguanylate cyclase [unclassified Vibrio]MDK9739053.1 diguanylate cyclase [Vibrio sp. D404a]MDK9799587.1 diguanylate cyclase [Vibrio sp. D449a]